MSASNTSTTCLFLELPAEIRNSIYGLVLLSEAPIEVNANLKKFTAILDTCTQIRKEATGIASQNTFEVACGTLPPIRLQAWIRALGKTDQLVKRLKVAFDLSSDAGKDRQRLTDDHREDKFLKHKNKAMIHWHELELEGRNFNEVIRYAVKDGYLAQVTLIFDYGRWSGCRGRWNLRQGFASVPIRLPVEYISVDSV